MAGFLCNAAMAGGARAPELERHVVARQQVAPVPAEAQVRDAGDDLAEEAPRARRLLLAQIKPNPQLGLSNSSTGWVCRSAAGRAEGLCGCTPHYFTACIALLSVLSMPATDDAWKHILVDHCSAAGTPTCS